MPDEVPRKVAMAVPPDVAASAGEIAGRWAALNGERVVVIEDGPSTTHGGLPYGAGYAAARDAGAAEIVHPRPYADPAIAALFAQYPRLGPVLPAMGYSPAQLEQLVRSIDAVPADVVVSGTPVDLAALAVFNKPVVRARYEFAEAELPGLGDAIDRFLDGILPAYTRRA